MDHSKNIIKDNERTKRTSFFFLNISLILFSKKGPQFVVSWEIDWETYTQREDFFPYLLPGARGCQRFHPLASRVVREASDRLRVPCSTPDNLPLSKSDLEVLITWSLSGYTPVVPDCLEALPCLLIITWQLVKAHGVTRNEPKIHVICYITTVRFGRKMVSNTRWNDKIVALEKTWFHFRLMKAGFLFLLQTIY